MNASVVVPPMLYDDLKAEAKALHLIETSQPDGAIQIENVYGFLLYLSLT